MPRFRSIVRSLTVVAGSLVALGAASICTPEAGALVVDGTPLSKPSNSWVGSWNGSTGIAIGPRAVLTAKHVQGYVTQHFLMNGKQYAAKAIHLHPSADLQIIELSQDLPGWHQIATTAAGGQRVVVAGMGYVAGSAASNGYSWSSTKAETWGMNSIDTVTSWYIVTRFDASAKNPSEAMFATYDSGGGVFIQQANGSLSLAGIAVSISSSTGFSAFGDRGYSVNVIPQASWLAPFVQAPCFGDLNGDRIVNSADFSVLLSNFGKPGALAGDLDKDGDCDFADFSLLTGAFGSNCQ